MIVLAAGVLVSCGSSATTTSATAPAAAGNVVTLSEYKVDVPSTTLKAGAVTYTITNSGAIEHELLVFQSDLAAGSYPYDSSQGKFDEAAASVKSISDGSNLAAGASQSRTVTLTAPGTYLFVCNLTGHYKAGMYTVVTVTG